MPKSENSEGTPTLPSGLEVSRFMTGIGGIDTQYSPDTGNHECADQEEKGLPLHGSVKSEKTDQKHKQKIGESSQTAVVPTLFSASAACNKTSDQESQDIDDVRKIGQGTFAHACKAKQQSGEQGSCQDETKRVHESGQYRGGCTPHSITPLLVKFVPSI